MPEGAPRLSRAASRAPKAGGGRSARPALPEAEALAAEVARYDPAADRDLILRAYAAARAAHEGQTRENGEPYFTHPVAVAKILAGYRLDAATIATALLHDTVEDTGAWPQANRGRVRYRCRKAGGWGNEAHPPRAAVGAHQAGGGISASSCWR